MNGKTTLAVLLVAVISMSVLVPVSTASNIRVMLNPTVNEATVDAYINSSLVVSANNTTFIGQALLNDIFPHSSELNLTINSTSQNESSVAFTALNFSISEREHDAYLKSLNLAFKRTVENSTAAGIVTVYVNNSLELQMVVANIFHNNSANLTWRNFSTERGISLNGTDINSANFTSGYFNTNQKVNTVNFTAFSKSLVQWNRTYDSATNTTTFSMDAGKTVDITYNNTAYGFNLTFTIDPTYSISAPGYDTAGSDSISIGNPPATSPLIYYSIAAIILGGSLVLLYIRRRGVK